MLNNIKSNNQLSGFYVNYNGSVQNERKGIRGISHLMEHLIHGQNKKIYNDFDNYGISHNAFTSENMIVFHITGLDKFVNKFKYNFYDNLSQFNITDKVFQNEKNIVIQEYLDYFNDQFYNHYENLKRKYLNSYGAIGELQDLKNINMNDCKKYFDLQFKYPTPIINVSKEYPYNKVVDFLPIEHFDVPKFQLYDFKLEKNNDNNKVSIISLSKNIVESDFAIVNFIIGMLSSGLNSPMYELVREKYGLVYNINMMMEPITNNSGLMSISALTSNIKNGRKIEVILNHIFNNNEKYLTQERFDIYKRLTQIELLKSKMYIYNDIEDYLYNDEWNIKNYINKITLNDIHKVFDKYFKNWHFSIDKTEF